MWGRPLQCNGPAGNLGVKMMESGMANIYPHFLWNGMGLEILTVDVAVQGPYGKFGGKNDGIGNDLSAFFMT